MWSNPNAVDWKASVEFEWSPCPQSVHGAIRGTTVWIVATCIRLHLLYLSFHIIERKTTSSCKESRNRPLVGSNLVLRLAWLQTVLHSNLGSVDYRVTGFFLAALEVIRRGQWKFYRLEHLNNAGKFKDCQDSLLLLEEYSACLSHTPVGDREYQSIFNWNTPTSQLGLKAVF